MSLDFRWISAGRFGSRSPGNRATLLVVHTMLSEPLRASKRLKGFRQVLARINPRRLFSRLRLTGDDFSKPELAGTAVEVAFAGTAKVSSGRFAQAETGTDFWGTPDCHRTKPQRQLQVRA